MKYLGLRFWKDDGLWGFAVKGLRATCGHHALTLMKGTTARVARCPINFQGELLQVAEDRCLSQLTHPES